MDAGATYPWPGLEGLWVTIAVVIALWWWIVQHRMETLAFGATVDIVGTGDRLMTLLAKEAEAG